ncbi:hypothetical protein QQ045_024875 [Rhodiola kirilowii]
MMDGRLRFSYHLLIVSEDNLTYECVDLGFGIIEGFLMHHGFSRAQLSVLIEGTSGNTSIALAAFGAAKGYRVILVMPAWMSMERMVILLSYGAELIITDPDMGIDEEFAVVDELVKKTPNGINLNQFINYANPNVSYHTQHYGWARCGSVRFKGKSVTAPH